MGTTQNRSVPISTTLLDDVGVLRDRDLWLDLRAREPENPVRGWVPAYRFAMRLDGVEHAVGRLGFRVGSAITRLSTTPDTWATRSHPPFVGATLRSGRAVSYCRSRDAMAFKSCGSPAIPAISHRDAHVSDSEPN